MARKREREKRGLWKRGLEKIGRGDDRQMGCPLKKQKSRTWHEMRAKRDRDRGAGRCPARRAFDF